jgi:hypothetical protein
MARWFNKSPTYSSFAIEADRLGQRAIFKNAAGEPIGGPLVKMTIAEILKEKDLGGQSRLHPQDRALLTLALATLRDMAEDRRQQDSAAAYDAAIRTRAFNLELARVNDLADLPAPDKPRHRHLLKEPEKKYKDFTIAGYSAETLHADLKLRKPVLRNIGTRTEPHFRDEMNEAVLLSAYRVCSGMNYDDQVMLHEALLTLRRERREKNYPVINLRPTLEKRPDPEREKRTFRGMIFY